MLELAQWGGVDVVGWKFQITHTHFAHLLCVNSNPPVNGSYSFLVSSGVFPGSQDQPSSL